MGREQVTDAQMHGSQEQTEAEGCDTAETGISAEKRRDGRQTDLDRSRAP